VYGIDEASSDLSNFPVGFTKVAIYFIRSMNIMLILRVVL